MSEKYNIPEENSLDSMEGGGNFDQKDHIDELLSKIKDDITRRVSQKTIGGDVKIIEKRFYEVGEHLFYPPKNSLETRFTLACIVDAVENLFREKELNNQKKLEDIIWHHLMKTIPKIPIWIDNLDINDRKWIIEIYETFADYFSQAPETAYIEGAIQYYKKIIEWNNEEKNEDYLSSLRKKIEECETRAVDVEVKNRNQEMSDNIYKQWMNNQVNLTGQMIEKLKIVFENHRDRISKVQPEELLKKIYAQIKLVDGDGVII